MANQKKKTVVRPVRRTRVRKASPKTTGVETAEVSVEATPPDPVQKPQSPTLPVFEKKQVLKVLGSGHTRTHFHCLVEGGLTMHVPKSRFNHG